MSQTPTEPASPRVLARARARGDFPYAAEWTFGVVLCARVLVSAQVPGVWRGFERFAKGCFRGELSWLDVPLRPLGVLLVVPAVAAFLCVLAQRAPTLRAAAGADAQRRGRPGHGRLLQGLMTGGKLLVLSASLFALVYDGLQGWLALHTRSASDLLAVTGRVVPAMLLRAAWVCVLLGAVELVVQYIARMQRLRMTRQEGQDEQRELAADPRMLSERRSRAAQDGPARVSSQLELSQLAAAALVITGASRVFALEYTPEHGVPRVWLSAEGTLALELLSHAYSLGLPIVSDELLAAALSRVQLRAAVPADLHRRVAIHLAAHGIKAAEAS